MNKRRIGDVGESLVIFFLLKNNIKVLARNYYTKHGEIDLIYKDNGYLVFAEVKERTGLLYGNPLEAIGYRKMQSIRYSSRVYMYTHGISENTPVRYDAFGIQNGEVTWIKDAFGT